IAPLKVTASIAAEHDRVEIAGADIASGGASVHLTGAIEDLRAPHGEFRYKADAAVSEIASILEIKLLERGGVQSQGTLTWKGGADFTATGDLHASGVEYL